MTLEQLEKERGKVDFSMQKCVIWQVLYSFQWIIFEVDEFQGKLEERHVKQRSF